MTTNRRHWLKQISLGIAGLSLAPVHSFALPPQEGNLSYDPGDGPVRLSSNENPYGPSPMARKAMAEYLNSSNRYGWKLGSELVSAIAKLDKVNDDNILLSAGSTEILELVTLLAAQQKGSFVLADPTFRSWVNTAEKLGLEKIAVPLTADKRHNLDAMRRAIRPDTRMVYVCNPNNPTGTVCDPAALQTFIKEAAQKTLVLLDEAYIHYCGQASLATLAATTENIVIARTFSKVYGLAGARVGYAIAHNNTMDHLLKLKVWPNGSLATVSVAAALASLKDEAFVKETITLNEQAKNYTVKELQKTGITCIPSHTNFLYFSLANYKNDFFASLKTNRVEGTRIIEEDGKWSRITIGTMAEMERFIQSIT